MNTPHRTTTTKSTGIPGNGTQVLREAVESGSAQAKETFEEMSAAAGDAMTLMKDSYSTAVQRAQEYNSKLIEFAQTNMQATVAFVQKLSSVKSPTEFFELSTSHSRKQFETLTEQAQQLATLAQKAALATAERVETDLAKTSSRRS